MLLNLGMTLLWLIVIIQGVLIVALVHQVAALRLLANAGGPVSAEISIGGLAPEFVATDLQSGQKVHSSALHGRQTVMCFMTADCHVCRTLAFELSKKRIGELSGLVIYYDDGASSDSSIFMTLASKVLVLRKDAIDLSTLFHLERFPVAVVINQEWRISAVSHPIRADDLLTSLNVSREQMPGSPGLARLAD